MYQTRQTSTKKIPIPRKGTKYVARALTHLNDSVPVVIAVRDMLKLTKTSREVKKMIRDGLIEINGRKVRDLRESVKVLNVLKAGKSYLLTLIPTGKFSLVESKKSLQRTCKIVNKKQISKEIFQLNLHDGSNVLTKENKKINDSIVMDFEGKIKETIALEKGKDVLVYKGKYLGHIGKIKEIKENSLEILFDKETKNLKLNQVIVL